MPPSDIAELRRMLKDGSFSFGPDIVALFRSGQHSDVLPVKIVHKKFGFYADVFLLNETETLFLHQNNPNLKRTISFPKEWLEPPLNCTLASQNVPCVRNRVYV